MKSVVIDERRVLFFEKFFPLRLPKKAFFKHEVLIGIGGNIGDVKKSFKKLYMYLRRDRRFHILQTSPIFKNPPFGYIHQDDFYNAVIRLQTSLSPRVLLKILLNIEKIFKRSRSFKNAPRTLDIDIIFYDNLKYSSKTLLIPHPKWSERESVVVPLNFIIQ